MRRYKKCSQFDYARLEHRNLLAGDLVGPEVGGASLDWVDAAGNEIGANDIPNRTDVFARLVTTASLPTTVTGSVYEDDLFGDDFMTNIQLDQVDANTWIGTWRAIWSDDGTGVPEYYFEVSGVSGDSNLLTVIQGNAWHAQTSASGTLDVGSDFLMVGFGASAIPAGLRLSQVAFEIDFGNVNFSNGPHAFEIALSGPHGGWAETVSIESNYDFSEPIVATFRTAGCDTGCAGSDFPASFLEAGIANGFYGDWSIDVANLETGDTIEIGMFRVTLTFFSRLNTSGYDPNLTADQPYPTNSQRENGYLSDFLNNELSNPGDVSNAVIMIHGWNPGDDGLGNNFTDVYSGFWNSLEQTVQAFAAQAGSWLVAEYDWVNDAATGSNDIFDVPLTLARSPLASRDVGTAHGAFLGRAIRGINQSLFPNLESLHLIAFSAGNWVAMEAADYLRATGYNGAIQFTSLDPFVPSVETVLGITVGVEAERIFESGSENLQFPNDLLDNYWVDDGETDVFVGWTSGHYGGWDISRELDESTNPAPLFQASYDTHSGPIGWYAETADYLFNGGSINTLVENGQLIGFAASHLYQDWRLETATELAAESLSVQRGFKIQGSVSELVASDNADLILRVNSPPVPMAQIELTTVAPSSNLEFLGFRLETQVQRPGVSQTIELFNYQSGAYEVVDVRDADLSDSITELAPRGIPADFVDDATSVMKARLSWVVDWPATESRQSATAGRQPLVNNGIVRVDQAVWLIDGNSPSERGMPPGIFPPDGDGDSLRIDKDEVMTSVRPPIESVSESNWLAKSKVAFMDTKTFDDYLIAEFSKMERDNFWL